MPVLFTGACLYKGQIYSQGQTWQDGCDLDCECTDALNGVYRCTDRWVLVLTFKMMSTCTLVPHKSHVLLLRLLTDKGVCWLVFWRSEYHNLIHQALKPSDPQNGKYMLDTSDINVHCSEFLYLTLTMVWVGYLGLPIITWLFFRHCCSVCLPKHTAVKMKVSNFSRECLAQGSSVADLQVTPTNGHVTGQYFVHFRRRFSVKWSNREYVDNQTPPHVGFAQTAGRAIFVNKQEKET